MTDTSESSHGSGAVEKASAPEPAADVVAEGGKDGELTEGFELRILDPRSVRLYRAGGVARLTLEGDRSYVRVMVTRAFPLSNTQQHYGLLDGFGKDIGLVVEPRELDAVSRQVAEEELTTRYFVPVILHVVDVEEEFGTTTWTVQTDRGDKVFVMRQMRDNIADLGGSRVLLTDVDGNRFELPDVYALDQKSLNVILRHL